MLGKEAGLLVTSGTQGNLIAIMTHCARGEEIILGDKAHTFKYEAGGTAALGGVHPHTIPVQTDGTLLLDDIRHAIRDDNYHYPRTKLITLENTQGTVGGIPISKEYTAQVAEIARENDLILHIDGARFFNASTALGISAKNLLENVDTMTFCLSKGLCAPVGSILVGPADFIKEARRVRKVLGGGMRQAGILAAAGLIAIHEMTQRLAEDHAHARKLGEQLATVPCMKVKSVHTNFVFADLLEDAPVSPDELMQRMENDFGVIMRPYPGFKRTFRFVTHYWISADDVDKTVDGLRQVLS